MKLSTYTILLIFLTVVFVCGCGGEKKPLYQGLPLKTWVDRLESGEPEIRADALKVIADIGRSARVAEDNVRKLARNDPSIKVRLNAIEALEAMGASTVEFLEFIDSYYKPIIPIGDEETVDLDEEISTEDELSEKIDTEDDLAYLRALEEGTLDTIQEKTFSVMPRDSADYEVWLRERIHEEVQDMMNKLSNPTMLAAMLEFGGDLEREYAACKLAELSGDNPEIIEALEKAEDDPLEEVRQAAEKALENWQLDYSVED